MLDFSVTFIITIINITILFFILRAILFKPVTKFMAERTNRIHESIDQAEKNKSESRKLLAEYEEKLRNAEAQAQEILKSARENAERQAEQIVAGGKLEAESIVAAAHEHIVAEHQAAMAKFSLEAAALVMSASAKLTAGNFGGEDNRRYVNMILDELVARKGLV